MDIRVTLQHLPGDTDAEDFAAFLKRWLEEEYASQRLQVSIDYGDRFQVLVNGLENSEEAWQVGNQFATAKLAHRTRRQNGEPLPLFRPTRKLRGMI